MPAPRNPVIRAGAALLRKGGPHAQSASGQRHQMRQQIDDEIAEYLSERQARRQRQSINSSASTSQRGQKDGATSGCPDSFVPTTNSKTKPGIELFANVHSLTQMRGNPYVTLH